MRKKPKIIKQVYHLGIIDYLQQWDLNKKSENLAKRLLTLDASKISAVNPVLYEKRFVKFVEDSILGRIPPEESVNTSGFYS